MLRRQVNMFNTKKQHFTQIAGHEMLKNEKRVLHLSFIIIYSLVVSLSLSGTAYFWCVSNAWMSIIYNIMKSLSAFCAPYTAASGVH